MLKNYKLLNEVLIEWNKSSKEDSDNVFLKSEDIKRSLDKCFIYRVENEDQPIHIFYGNRDIAYPWQDFKKYKNKVWINGEHVELDDNGYTVDIFEPGEYEVYIKDIDKVTNTNSIFYMCNQLVSVYNLNIPSIGICCFANCRNLKDVVISNFVTKIATAGFLNCANMENITIPNSVTEIGDIAFKFCKSLKTVYVEDINKFNQIEFDNKWSDPRHYGAKVIELKK